MAFFAMERTDIVVSHIGWPRLCPPMIAMPSSPTCILRQRRSKAVTSSSFPYHAGSPRTRETFDLQHETNSLAQCTRPCHRSPWPRLTRYLRSPGVYHKLQMPQGGELGATTKKRRGKNACSLARLMADSHRLRDCPSCLHPSHSSFPSSFLLRHRAHLHQPCPLGLALPPSCLALPLPSAGLVPKTPRFSIPSLWY